MIWRSGGKWAYSRAVAAARDLKIWRSGGKLAYRRAVAAARDLTLGTIWIDSVLFEVVPPMLFVYPRHLPLRVRGSSNLCFTSFSAIGTGKNDTHLESNARIGIEIGGMGGVDDMD